MQSLGKWLWRIGDESDGLWKQDIYSKYDISRDGWLVRDALPRFFAIWKGILASKEAFFRQVRYRVGKGDNLFLDGPMGGRSPLGILIPRFILLC